MLNDRYLHIRSFIAHGRHGYMRKLLKLCLTEYFVNLYIENAAKKRSVFINIYHLLNLLYIF